MSALLAQNSKTKDLPEKERDTPICTEERQEAQPQHEEPSLSFCWQYKAGQFGDKSIRKQYSQQDIEKWKTGGDNFRKLWKQVPDETFKRRILNEIHKGKYWPPDVAEVQALMLGEKPAVCSNYFATDLVNQIADAGFSVYEYRGEDGEVEHWLYDREKVIAVMDRFPSLFAQQGYNSPEDAFKALETRPDSLDYATQLQMTGLILGYPPASVQDLAHELVEKQSKTKIDQLQNNDKQGFAKGIARKIFLEIKGSIEGWKTILGIKDSANFSKESLYGVAWEEKVTNSESEGQKQRLKAAFLYSELLKRDS